jgi:hypothetical protein
MEPDDEIVDSPQSTQSIDPVESRELWDKRLDESAKAFGAFTLFRDAEKRSFKSVAEKLSCSAQNVFQWSSRFDWRGRCDAFDIEMDRLQRADLARSRVRMRDRHLQVARAMLNVAAYGLKEWQARVEQKLPLHLEPEQIAMLVRSATELEYRTVGAEGEHKFTQINVVIGEHRYEDEQGVHVIPEKTFEQFDLERWEGLSDEEKAAEAEWKTPPKGRKIN